jgi:hypothetical protein
MSELQPVPIPPNVGEEIKRLHLDLVAKARQYEASRLAFGEFLRGAKKILGIPADQPYTIADDASAFIPQPKA